MKPYIIKLRYVALPIMVEAVGLALIFLALSAFYQNNLSTAFGQSTAYHHYLANIKWSGPIVLGLIIMSIYAMSLFWLKKPLAFLEFEKSRHHSSVIFSIMLFQSGLLILAYTIGTYGTQTTYQVDNFNDWELQGKPTYFKVKVTNVEGIRDIDVRYNYLSKNTKEYYVFCTILLDKNKNLWLGISDYFFISSGIEKPKSLIIEKIIIANKKCDNIKTMSDASFKTSNFNLENNGFLAAAKRLDESSHLDLKYAQLLVHSKISMEDSRYTLFGMALILTLLAMLFLSYDTHNARINWDRYREAK
ncbi:hypothetical protein HWQ46_08310 [Shewanella sp. D64]|uniref:hypothetical protein n=1 Tax=unclassified Shewanella TaxID=196818 RepID=UPI0022BA4BC6|nr:MULTISPECIES: hypothetical protein [unclassified Shewanella]MEC4725545.1 hypothetical protein [Shewanella sp. D64]MEC4738636.1 hypothetical protein [Shewanella sp. E94]WBJ94935.1 hypothetical protein HWQ47_24385 [Shewanella sp. MTB7]